MTKSVDSVVLPEDIKSVLEDAELRKRCGKKYNCLFDEEWIKFSVGNEKGYWNRKTEVAIPVQRKYEKEKESCFGISCEELTFSLAEDIFGENSCPPEICAGIKRSKAYENKHWIGVQEGSYCFETGQYADWRDSDSVPIRVIKIEKREFQKKAGQGTYKILRSEVLSNAIAIMGGEEISSLSHEKVDKLAKVLKIDREKFEKQLGKRWEKGDISAEVKNQYIKYLCDCDKRRVDLEAYEEKRLTDSKEGHWELWQEEEKGEGMVLKFKHPLVARNPVADIHEDGLIGIDFGTKSTIVSKIDEREKIELLRIGIGQLAKKAEPYHYENPTVMEFINFGKFLKDYKAMSGRPKTSIEDLRVSHMAENDLKECENSNTFYSYFYDIKQWCGENAGKIKIADQTDNDNGIAQEWELPDFVNITEAEFNPLEIYAYYLGLYINNMWTGIYVDYLLSFPVAFDRTVKEKMRESFEKGLKKSLPASIGKDQEAVEFRVRLGVSEPAAYAITALKEYGFEPKEDENIFYGIFDFGGGTTDFDFGLWRQADDSPQEENYDYVITHFGSEKDEYLGGENLLQLMAFEIFKANAEQLREQGFSFLRPKECDTFAGDEILIANSREARRNTKQLMEELRPFWEGILAVASDSGGNEENDQEEQTEGDSTASGKKSYKGYWFRNTADWKFPIDDKEEKIKVDLFDKKGERKQKVSLSVADIDLIEILEKRIEKGVDNFFQASRLAFREKELEDSEIDGIHIFLAGNSSKSPILKKIFEEHMEQEQKAIEEMNGDRAADKKWYHKLFPPLGTEEAREKQKERNVETRENDISAPTGKTGVAYGLIEGRPGGRIKVNSEIGQEEQAKFRYNIGINKRGKFDVKLERNMVEHGRWIKFGNASEEDFEVYYTSLPNAGNMYVKDKGVYRKRLQIPREWMSEQKNVYIRPEKDSLENIEYCVSEKEPAEMKNIETKRAHLKE